MLSARRIIDGQAVIAYFESKRNGPFACLTCGETVLLKDGRKKISHFAHEDPLSRHRDHESELHRRCKTEIFKALESNPGVEDVALERSFGRVRPDVSAIINGVRVGIEVQISALSVESILERTIAYHQQNIAVLWLLPWTSDLNRMHYAPQIWERWIHAAYFGRVYYWLNGIEAAEYSFGPRFRTVRSAKWVTPSGKRTSAGGYVIRSARLREAIRGRTLNLVHDFERRRRFWWQSGSLKIPDATLFIARQNPSNS